MKTEQFVKITYYFWEGAFCAVDDDAPDGAWLQMHIDTVDHCMQECLAHFNIPKRSCKFDSHDVVMAFLEMQAEKAEEEDETPHPAT